MYCHQNVYFYIQLMLYLCIVVVNCSALQLFLAYNLRKPLKISKIALCNISLYRDTQVAIYRYVQIVYRYISNREPI